MLLTVLHLSDVAKHIDSFLQLPRVKRTQLQYMPMQCTEVYLLIPLIEMNRLIDKRLQIIAELFQQLNRLKLPHLLH